MVRVVGAIIWASLVVAALFFGSEAPLLAFSFSAVLLVLSAVTLWSGQVQFVVPPIGWGVAGIAVSALAIQFLNAPQPVLRSPVAVIVVGVVLFWVGSLWGQSRERTDVASKAASLAFLILAILAFLDFVIAPEAIFGQPKAYHEARLTGPFLSANTAATFFMMASLWGLGSVLRSSRGTASSLMARVERLGRQGLIDIILFLFAVTCVVLTGSRAGVAITAVGVLALVSWHGLRRGGSGQQLFVPLGAAAVGCLLLLVSGEVIAGRLLESGADGTGRGVLWAASIEAWRQAPIFGHGLGNFPEALRSVATEATAPNLIRQGAAHNLPLQWLVEMGLVGTALGAAGVIWLVWELVGGLSRMPRHRGIVRVVIVILLCVLLHGAVDYAVQIPAIFWWISLLSGMAVGITRSVQRGERPIRPAS